MPVFVMPARRNPPAGSRPPAELRFSALPSGPARTSAPFASQALHITLETKPGREAEVERLLEDVRAAVESERGALPWHGPRRSRCVFEIFEMLPSQAAHATHLKGRDGRMLARSPLLLARLPGIVLLEVLLGKQG